MHRNPFENPMPWEAGGEEEESDNGEFQCPCGDEHCRGYQDDTHLIILFGKHFASDCAFAKGLSQIAQGRQWDAVNDERRGK